MTDPQQLGRRWIEAWNARDLEAILEHYADDVEVRSPRVAERFGTPDGRLRGKERLREYFAIGLQKPDLHFELVEVLEGPGTMTVVYRRENGALVADCSELDSEGRITRMIATYGKTAEAPSA
jgi:ketosteroid isomerase-like protein